MQRLADPRPAGAGLLAFTMDAAGVAYLVQQRGPAARSHQGLWELTAGGVLEPGEDALDGALRKHWLEMGEPPELLVTASVTWLRARGSGSPSRRHTAFLARAARRYQPQPPDPGVVSNWQWASLEEAMRLPLHPSFAVELAELSAAAERS